MNITDMMYKSVALHYQSILIQKDANEIWHFFLDVVWKDIKLAAVTVYGLLDCSLWKLQVHKVCRVLHCSLSQSPTLFRFGDDMNYEKLLKAWLWKFGSQLVSYSYVHKPNMIYMTQSEFKNT